MASRCALVVVVLFNVFNCPTSAIAPSCLPAMLDAAHGMSSRMGLGLRLKGGEGAEDAVNQVREKVAPNPRKIFVGNIPPKVTQDEIKAHFASAGEITSIEIKLSPKGLTKGYAFIEFASEAAAAEAIRSKSGSMFVHRVLIVRADQGFDPEIAAQRQAKRAASRAAREAYLKKTLPENEAEEKLKAQEAKFRRHQIGGPDYWPPAPPACRVYVGNIKFGTRWQEVRDHLSSAGQVVFGRIIKQRYENEDGSVTYRSKGFAIVQFATPEEAGNAVQKLNESELNGRRLFVRPDTSRVAAGGRRGGRQNQTAAGAGEVTAAA